MEVKLSSSESTLTQFHCSHQFLFETLLQIRLRGLESSRKDRKWSFEVVTGQVQVGPAEIWFTAVLRDFQAADQCLESAYWSIPGLACLFPTILCSVSLALLASDPHHPPPSHQRLLIVVLKLHQLVSTHRTDALASPSSGSGRSEEVGVGLRLGVWEGVG